VLGISVRIHGFIRNNPKSGRKSEAKGRHHKLEDNNLAPTRWGGGSYGKHKPETRSRTYPVVSVKVRRAKGVENHPELKLRRARVPAPPCRKGLRKRG